MNVCIKCSKLDQMLISREFLYYNGDTNFVFNNEDNCDYTVNYCGLTTRFKSCNSKKNILVLGEPTEIYPLYLSPYKKFDLIITCQYFADIADKVYLHSPILPWMIGYDYVKHKIIRSDLHKHYEKTKLLSIISSDKEYTSTQIQRKKFTEAIKEYYGDKVDVYGMGNVFTNKDDALLQYKYHIVIENTSTPHMWTEKLSDCILSECVPIYYGCPNVNDYFESIKQINIYDIDESIKIINKIINSSIHSNILEVNKNRVLSNYNIFAVLDKIIKDEKGNRL